MVLFGRLCFETVMNMLKGVIDAKGYGILEKG